MSTRWLHFGHREKDSNSNREQNESVFSLICGRSQFSPCLSKLLHLGEVKVEVVSRPKGSKVKVHFEFRSESTETIRRVEASSRVACTRAFVLEKNLIIVVGARQKRRGRTDFGSRGPKRPPKLDVSVALAWDPTSSDE